MALAEQLEPGTHQTTTRLAWNESHAPTLRFPSQIHDQKPGKLSPERTATGSSPPHSLWQGQRRRKRRDPSGSFPYPQASQEDALPEHPHASDGSVIPAGPTVVARLETTRRESIGADFRSGPCQTLHPPRPSERLLWPHRGIRVRYPLGVSMIRLPGRAPARIFRHAPRAATARNRARVADNESSTGHHHDAGLRRRWKD